MAARVRVFGGWAIQGLMVLFGAASILMLARDGFHFFLHDAFTWLLVLKDAIVSPVLDQPLVSQTVERIVARMELSLSGLGVRSDLVLYSHWKHAFVLLSLALMGYAHVLRDFAARPATSVFRYANALGCSLIGGLMVGTAHLGHPGVVAYPLAALLAFLGVNSLWGFATERQRAVRLRAGLRGFVWLSLATLIVAATLDVGHSEDLNDESSSHALMAIALIATGLGLWATVFGLKASAGSPEQSRWMDNRGRRMGLRVLATMGLSAFLAACGHLSWGMERQANAANEAMSGIAFQDCGHCPDMVTIPAGSFVMGTTQAQVQQLKAAQAWDEKLYKDELPARQVAVRSFALSRTEVTVGQFEAFLAATGYAPGGRCWGLHEGKLDFHKHNNWRDPGFEHGEDHPVVCVNWRDAQAYVRWLSLSTGDTYRLPTEAEWEYAARAGTRTHYFWGDDVEAGCAYGNGADAQGKLAFPKWQTHACDDGATFTAPVGSFAPNAFGLFDMTGNVWEWVQDCYHAHDAAPVKVSAVAPSQTCSQRVIRGGSWTYGSHALRSANREPHHPYTRGSGLGFRVARTL